MNTTHNRRKTIAAALGAAAATVAAPALLLVGAGTAHAGGLNVSWDEWAGGITAHIRNFTGQSGWCTYSADWYVAPPFYSEAQNTYDLVIPGLPEHRSWPVHVNCDDGNSFQGWHYY